MNEKEIHYIFTLKPCYNMAPGGLGHTGVVWSEELMSGSNNLNFGKSLSEETKQKLSNALKGRIIPDDVRLKISHTMKGVPKTQETRTKISEFSKRLCDA